jgi:hypothetical protein
MWTVALPLLQPTADARGFGTEWRTMLKEKTGSAAKAAEAAAWVAEAAWAAETAAWAAETAAWAAEAAREAAALAAKAAAKAAPAKAAAAGSAAAAWATINPCQLLADLIAVGSTNSGGSECSL